MDIRFDQDASANLDLGEEMVEAFDLIISKFQNLQQLILYSIRIEIRSHAIFYLDLAMREGNYSSEEENSEPDPYIGLLNNDLTIMEEIISESLPPRQARFLFDGITELMSTVLISNVRTLRQISGNGVNRLLSNILALQQNLISFTTLYENHLDRAKKYLSLLQLEGPVFQVSD